MSDIGILRNIESEELELMLKWRNTPEIRMNMYTQHEISLQEHLAWWKRTAIREDQKYFMYAYNDLPLGIVAFNNIDKINSNSSWAFYAAPNAPRGSGSRMELLALDFSFHELKLHKLHCEVLATNMQVVKMHQKFGFQIEGILRQQHKIKNDLIDVYRLGILSTEWLENRSALYEKISNFTR